MQPGGPKNGKCRRPCNENLDRHEFAARWAKVFAAEGWEALHWSQVGAHTASDLKIMVWARGNGYAVFTHHLDFSALLAATQGEGPSVTQVRTQNIFPEAIGNLVIDSLKRFRDELEKGAIITIDPSRAKVRILPLKQ
jgi:predicted nuclease of predicted toxin-antitoxin system